MYWKKLRRKAPHKGGITTSLRSVVIPLVVPLQSLNEPFGYYLFYSQPQLNASWLN